MAKYRANSTDTWKTLKIKALDSMPVGTMVDYDGEDIPTGWEEVNDYSTTEIDTGKKWIDGKPIYRKVIDCGAMPNGTTKQVSSGLTNVFITQIYGIAYNSASTLTLPDVNPSGVQYSLRLFYTYESNAVGITTSADRSGYNGYVILEYTKTTD